MTSDTDIMKKLNPDKMPRASAVDPSVKLGPIEGPINGEVPLERTMAKPEAFKTNRYSKGMSNE